MDKLKISRYYYGRMQVASNFFILQLFFTSSINAQNSLNKNQSDTLHFKKNASKKSHVYVGPDHNGNLEIEYKLGVGTAKVILYNSDAQKIGEYDLTGTGTKIAVYHMDKTYVYDLYINGQFIKTKKITYVDDGYNAKTSRRGY